MEPRGTFNLSPDTKRGLMSSPDPAQKEGPGMSLGPSWRHRLLKFSGYGQVQTAITFGAVVWLFRFVDQVAGIEPFPNEATDPQR